MTSKVDSSWCYKPVTYLRDEAAIARSSLVARISPVMTSQVDLALKNPVTYLRHEATISHSSLVARISLDMPSQVDLALKTTKKPFSALQWYVELTRGDFARLPGR